MTCASFCASFGRRSDMMARSGGQIPTLDNEKHLWLNGFRLVAGLDEVGRGAWAGPVFAAAVILPDDLPDLRERLSEVRDSKQLSPQQRSRLVVDIFEVALAVSVGQASHQDVDRFGVVAATRLAMQAALAGLTLRADFLLIDAVQLPQVSLPQQHIIRGDATCLSIAAASIIAKVARDDLCVELDRRYPGYGFANHKGYGTVRHREALAQLGPSPIHRRSYKPVRELSDLWGQ